MAATLLLVVAPRMSPVTLAQHPTELLVPSTIPTPTRMKLDAETMADGPHDHPDCGPPPAPLNQSVPNVLLIGDSISMGTGGDKYPDGSWIPLGYGWDVQQSLEPVGLAQVQHDGGWLLEGQAGASTHGAACIDHWLGDGLWDVVHVNFGLHDVDASEFVPPANYSANLDYIYSRIVRKLTGHGQMIWGTTSPVPYPSEYPLRNNSAVQHYNALAALLWASKPAPPAKGSVVVNDLYSLIIRACGSSGPLGSYASCSLQRLWWGPAGRPSPSLPPPNWRPKNGTTGGVHFNGKFTPPTAVSLSRASLSQHFRARYMCSTWSPDDGVGDRVDHHAASASGQHSRRRWRK